MQVWIDKSKGFAINGRFMDEKRYRGSRLCRSMGNPVMYQLVVLLQEGGPMTPSKLAKLTGQQISTVSSHLAKLRALDVVRYNTRGRETRYWLKHKGEMKEFLKAVEKFVEASAHGI